MASVAVMAACGGGGGTTTAGRTSATTLGAQLALLPITSVTAKLDRPYKAKAGHQLRFEDADLPVQPGTVEADWFQSGGRYVVLYKGLSLDDTGPVCPGNSIAVTSGGSTTFQHVTNGPTSPGACEGSTTPTPAVGVKTCGALVFYVTDIPTNIEGQLFGTVERFSADGTVVGVTSRVPTKVGATPAIDLNVPGFHVPAGFLPGGQAGDVTC